MKIFIVAGEASGDIHGANLVKELRKLQPDAAITGFGGQRMQTAGMKLLYNLADHAVIGFLEVIKNLVLIKHLLAITKQYFREEKPDVVVLIDYPGFNFKVGKLAHSLNIPVVYYIAPQIWAWWPGRIKEIKEFASKVLVVFPFEEEIYARAGIPVKWVGHPLLEHIPAATSIDIYEKYKLDQKKRLLGLLPGSRRQEIEHLLPVMLAAAGKVLSAQPDIELVLLRSSVIDRSLLEKIIQASGLAVKVVDDDSYQVRRQLTLAYVASGTATLEMAYLGIPMLIMYRVNALSYQMAKRLVKIPYIGLANIVSGQKVVPEFVQNAVEPSGIAAQTEKYLHNPAELKAIKNKLLQIKDKLGSPGASLRTAQEILAQIR
ncbi:MAG: lipid-A-disaccharide synthase [bacterium]|nr:lipid-A-disaccharide synthase [bacterium]MDD5354095.1 lipid-A-disaccharide synthase [bacterium]MDD5756361.1 lipid-A-disaccharide synthase [bacterium]